MSSSGPATEAGKEWHADAHDLDYERRNSPNSPCPLVKTIVAIEDEAIKPYARLVVDGTDVDERLYLTDPVYHGIVTRIRQGSDEAISEWREALAALLLTYDQVLDPDAALEWALKQRPDWTLVRREDEFDRGDLLLLASALDAAVADTPHGQITSRQLDQTRAKVLARLSEKP